MEFENKKLRDVADIAARIMLGQQPVTEKLHPNQQKLDVHEPEKDELTSDDFKKLRAGKKADVKKEEVEQIDELSTGTLKSYIGGAQKDRAAQSDSKNSGDREQAAYAKKQSIKRTLGIFDAKARLSKEEVEQIDELSTSTLKSYIGGAQKDRAAQSDSKNSGDKEQAAYAKKQSVKRTLGIVDAKARLSKEEVELDEVKMADLPSRKIQGRSYGASKPESDYVKGPSNAELKKIEAEKKKKKFSEMVDIYKTGGLKTFMESIPKEDELIDELSKDIAEYTMDVIDAGEYAEITIGEEATQDEFNAEIKKAQAKSEGKEKAQVAKPFVQAVKQEETEITDEMIFEMIENAGIDFESLSDEEFQNVANEAYEIIKERQMTDAEMEKKEKIVKSMKKGLSGFKDRYGDKAKNVMYATATKQAMK